MSICDDSLTSRSRGGAAVWVVIAMAGLAAVLIVVLATRDDPSEPPAAEPAFDEARAMQSLERLEEALASALDDRRDTAPVIADAGRVAERYPDWFPAQLAYGKMLVYADRPEEGYVQLRRAIELDPSDPEAHRLAGSVAMQLDRPVDGHRHFAQAVSLEPRNANTRVLLATALTRQGRHADAQRVLIDALQMDSSLHQAHFAMADLYAQQNKMIQALGQINRALELVDPQQPMFDAYLRRKASYLRRANMPEEALEVMRALPAAMLLDPAVSEEMATTLLMLGRPLDAARHYEQVLFIDPLAAWAVEEAARMRLQAGDPAAAREHLDNLRRLNPRSPRLAELERAAANP